MSEMVKHESGAVMQQPASMLEAVMAAVRDPNMDPARLREFLEIGERLEAKNAQRLFNEAVAAAQVEMPRISKNGLIIYKAGSKGTAFAKWDDIHKACMPILGEHGLSVSFSSELQGGNALKVEMTVKHVAGGSDSGSLIVPWLDTGGSKSPAQAAASSFTLAQRHVFVKYFNILTEDQDDDGSGKGVPEAITEEQARTIEDLLHVCAEKEAKIMQSFPKWLKSEFGVDGPRSLFQGAQLDAVMGMLTTKKRNLGL